MGPWLGDFQGESLSKLLGPSGPWSPTLEMGSGWGMGALGI